MSIRLKYFIIGALFGMCFPLGAFSFEFHAASLPFTFENITFLHQKNPLLFMIDSAPLFLGLFALLGGVSKEKSVLLISQLKSSAGNLSTNTDVLKQQTSDTLSRYRNSIGKLTYDYGVIDSLNRSSYSEISSTLEGSGQVGRQIAQMRQSLKQLSEFNAAVGSNNQRVKQYLDRYLDNVNQLHGYFEYLNDFSRHIEMLAVNSAIEANKHGAEGKAFMVFSKNIQELAQETKNRNKPIVKLLDGISEETITLNKVIETERENISSVLELAEQIDQSIQHFDEVVLGFMGSLKGVSQHLDQQNDYTQGFKHTLQDIGVANKQIMDQLEQVVLQQIQITQRMNQLTTDNAISS